MPVNFSGPGLAFLESRTGIHRRFRRLALLVAILLVEMTAACTRSTIPIDSTNIIPPTPTAEPVAEPTSAPDTIYRTADRYAVVWVPEEETLKLRDPAGIAGSIVDELDYDAHGIRITGNTTSLGSSLWVEIVGPDGEMGWVNSWNLTEDVPADQFCADPEIISTLESITQAIVQNDAAAIADNTNPKRGLILRHDWWNPEVIIRASDVPDLLTSREELDWGTLSGGDFAIEGSFTDVFSPIMDDVLSQVPTAVCGEIPSGVTSQPVVWPGEYENLHFYAFYRPSPEGGNRFDWRTLVFGFEFIQGDPYLTLLIHYHGDI